MGWVNRFASLEAAQEHIMIDLLGHDEGAWDEDDVEAACADFEARFAGGAWEIVDARTGVALPDGDRES